VTEPTPAEDADARSAAGTGAHGDIVPAGEAPKARTESSTDPDNGIVILWPDRASREETMDAEPPQAARRRRRMGAMAAVAVVAGLAGAAGGMAATLAVGTVLTPAPAAPVQQAVDETGALRDTVARLTADLGALRSELDKTGRSRTAQLGKLGERLDKVEKAQDDGAQKLAKLAEAQDKLRVSAADATGSITKSDARVDPARSDAGKSDAGKTAAAKPPIVEGWSLTKVAGGGAIVDGPSGLYEAFPGDPLPGLGRVDAVRYQDGRWVVVTSKGLIIRR
jgi:hypothetical protein